jgi:hypothetical protein
LQSSQLKPDCQHYRRRLMLSFRKWRPMNDFIVTDGHKFFMIAIAVGKRCLRDAPMTAGERLHHLKQMNGAVDRFLTAEMLQMIEPASDVEIAMIDAARELDRKERKPDDPLPPSVHILSRSHVFGHFRRLNPGIAAALEYARKREAKNAAAVTEPTP